MGLVDWQDVDPKPQSAGDNKDKYLRLEAGKKYRIRPCGKPLQIHRYYVTDATGKTRSAITEDPKTCIIKQKYPNEEAKPRYAINVIDRADGKIKILEAPPSVFRPMKEWAEATSKDPGGIDGADFAVSVEVPNGDKRRTIYKTMALVPTILSEEEVTYVKGNKHKLPEIYKPTPQDKIESVLFGPSPSSGGTNNGSASQAASAPRPAAKAAAADDDIGF